MTTAPATMPAEDTMLCDAYIALGSNLNEPLQQVTDAIAMLHNTPGIEVKQCSSWYRSVALGPAGQPDYINGVTHISTSLTPLDLLDCLQDIEHRQGRKREVRWGARTLDLDIILYGDQVIRHERLNVPHKEMKQRNFVLQPLLEIHQNGVLPDGSSIKDWLAAVGTAGLEKLSPSHTM